MERGLKVGDATRCRAFGCPTEMHPCLPASEISVHLLSTLMDLDQMEMHASQIPGMEYGVRRLNLLLIS